MGKLKAIIKTIAVYILSFAVIIGSITGITKSVKYYRQKKAVAAIPDRPVNLKRLANEPVDYEPTSQSYEAPDISELLFPRAWLNGYENCIFAARLNAMKFAGMFPGNWTIADFKKYFTDKELYDKWGLHVWDVTLNSKILDEIDSRLNPGSPYRYEWTSINTLDELIYLAKHKQHVLVGITVWLGPDRYNKGHRKNRNAVISHAVTITGIKSYDPACDLIEFETYDSLPFSFINYVPTYSKFNAKGWSTFNRQGVPNIPKKGRARSGYIIKIFKSKGARP